jgi:acyl-coenzyme A thioesterase PaaI-like protein
MTNGGDLTEATRKALDAFHHHAQTQHELFKTIPMKPTMVGRGVVEFQGRFPEHFADGEVMHGGFFTILLDTVLAVAAWSRMDTFEPMATINLKTDFFEGAAPGSEMRIKATCDSIADDVASCQGTIYTANGSPIAQADGTFMVGTKSPAVKGSRL